MARRINSQLKIEGILTARTPIHVGGYGESFETDMALAKNGNNEFYVPGTSLTGTLRSWFENAFGEDEMENLFGNKQADFASFVLIEDMRLPEDLRNSLQSELRDGVGIDRHYGTAADGAKYDRAILPKGTELKFEMLVEIASRRLEDKKRNIVEETETEFNSRIIKTKAMFGHLLEALQNGEIRLGASKTRGLGRVRLQGKTKDDGNLKFETDTKLEIKEQKLVGFDEKGVPEILKLLSNGGNNLSLSALPKSSDFQPKQSLNIIIDWKPKSPLMVKAGYDGIGVDTLPLVSANGKGNVSLVLPGSSVKGAFRAQAERILRTFSEVSAKGEFHEQIRLLDKKNKPTKSTELIGEIFGAKKETAKSTLGLGALSIDDCFAEKQMNAETWQAVEVGKFDNEATYSDTKLHEALRKVDLAKTSLSDDEKKAKANNFHISHHTAIDRFTGAASDGALFSVLKPSPKTVWENLHLSLDLRRISTENELCSLMLLLFVLRDFAQNRLPLGFAVNRGMGEVKDVSFEITGAYHISYKNGQFEFTDANLKTNMQTAWDDLEV